MTAITDQQRDLLTVCALRTEAGKSVNWHLIARTCQSGETLATVLGGEIPEDSAVARKHREVLRSALPLIDTARAHVDAELKAAASAGASLVTVLDEDYPANLRRVPNLPPFLFHIGALEGRDARSVAVVGTRNASDDGLRRAARMARGMVKNDVVVFSGLADGIDRSAHQATLDAGARTVAVMGTGIAAKYFPAKNRPLAARIVEHGGALLSQFWPTTTPARWTFPQRNVVMSGATMGTVVIEASTTSGAKMQAQIAAEHHKQVFLLHSLATAEPWAREMISDGRAVEVAELEDVLSRLGSAERVKKAGQLRLQLALAGL